jgi:hypothetical protein
MLFNLHNYKPKQMKREQFQKKERVGFRQIKNIDNSQANETKNMVPLTR